MNNQQHSNAKQFPRQTTIWKQGDGKRKEETIALSNQKELEEQTELLKKGAPAPTTSDPYLSALLAKAEHLAKIFISKDVAPHLADLESRKKRSTATEPTVSNTVKTRCSSAHNLANYTEDLINDVTAQLGQNEHLKDLPRTLKNKIAALTEDDLLDSALAEFAESSEKMSLSSIVFMLDKAKDTVLLTITQEIYKIWDLTPPLEQSSVEQLAYRVSNIEKYISTANQHLHVHQALLADIYLEVGLLIRRASLASFLEEDKKLRLEAKDGGWWSKLEQRQQTLAIEDLLKDFTEDDSWRNLTIIIIKGRNNTKSWAKVDFQNRNTRGKFEQWLKANRSNAPTTKSFWSSRMIPLDFIPIKDKLIKASITRVTTDWINLVIAQDLLDQWETDFDKVNKVMLVRLQWSVSPVLNIWVECLDPIHRHIWRAINFSRTDINHFKNYDLKREIPCPDTLEKAKEDPSYSFPRPSKFGALKLSSTRRPSLRQEEPSMPANEASASTADPGIPPPTDAAGPPPPSQSVTNTAATTGQTATSPKEKRAKSRTGKRQEAAAGEK